MTFDQRVEALAPLGFTLRQTRFLVTVALHSGYCLRRQYAMCAGLAYGKNVREFLDTLVERQLATRFTYRTNRGHLYHFYARSIYRAIGQEDDRHRRHTSPALIARRLMLLDTVLSEPHTYWLATEADKTDHFVTRCGIAPTDLPRAAHVDESNVSLTAPRPFGHKLPIGLLTGGRVQFVYLATAPGAAGFERFLRDHAALLRALPAWNVAVVQRCGPDASRLWHSTFFRVTEAVVRRVSDSPHNGQLIIRTLPYRYDQFGHFAGVL